MTIEQNKALARRVTDEGLNRQNPALVDELCSPDFAFHQASQTIRGLPAYKRFLATFFHAFPDAQFTTEQMIAEGDFVAIRRTFRGTQTGSLMGLPPTGRQVTLCDMALLRVEDGKFAEAWNLSDDLGLLQQLRVIPALAGAVFLAGLAAGLGLGALVRKRRK